MEDLKSLKREVLIQRLQTLTEELEELEEERSFVLKQTGLHLPGHTVKKYETELSSLNKSIAKLQEEIARRP